MGLLYFCNFLLNISQGQKVKRGKTAKPLRAKQWRVEKDNVVGSFLAHPPPTRMKTAFSGSHSKVKMAISLVLPL